jgi:hypothetical protein
VNATQTRTVPPPPIQFLRVDVEPYTGNDEWPLDNLTPTLERPHPLTRIQRRTLRRSTAVIRLSRPTSWATSTTPPRIC